MMRLWGGAGPIPGNWVDWQMFQKLFGEFYYDMQRLDHLCTMLRRRLDLGAQDNPQFSIAHAPALFQDIATHCEKFELSRAKAACLRLKEGVENGIKDDILLALLRELIEQIRTDGDGMYVYVVPSIRMSDLIRQDADWDAIVAKFPDVKADGESAFAALAVGLNTASVFHLMRVLEHGIAVLAKEVEAPFNRQNWQTILNEIESKIKKIAALGTTDDAKAERLRFLSEAAKEFFYFKDGWRNYVSHNHGHYDESQARSVLEHVRTFMLLLSTRL